MCKVGLCVCAGCQNLMLDTLADRKLDVDFFDYQKYL